MAHYLPHLNAALNALSTVLLVVGFVLIKRGDEKGHKRAMLAAFGVSCAFLVSYLTYHYAIGGSKLFDRQTYPRAAIFYYLILFTHVVLAAVTPFLAVATIYFGLVDNRRWHRILAKGTFPIWLYVSITGVMVYAMLYHLFPPQG